MDSSLRNHAMVSVQNQQQQRQRAANGGAGGLGASLAGYNQQQQQQQHGNHLPQHYQQNYSQQQSLPPRHGGMSSSYQQQQQHQQQHYGAAAEHMSVGSHYSRESHASSHNSSTVDEAYRRLGQRLSRRAHGGDPQSLPRRIARIQVTAHSGFSSYADAKMERESSNMTATTADNSSVLMEGDVSPNSATYLNRTNKVAKKRFSDHGDHHTHTNSNPLVDGQLKPPHVPNQRNGNIVRKITVNVNELFKVWQAEHAKEKKNHKRLSPNGPSTAVANNLIATGDLSPHRKAFSQMALDGGTLQHRSFHQETISTDFGNGNGSILNHDHGLLSAVLETASQSSSKQTNSVTERNISGADDNGSAHSKESRGSSSIATRSSVGTRNSMRSVVGNVPPRGKCLTQPPQAVSNEGLDNADGNLIVHENDAISVSRKHIHTLRKENMKHIKSAEFRVQSLLGQGTFAQVFQCFHVQTGNVVAVKVVKNKPAYTRQAAVEIDVFRALTKTSPEERAGSDDREDNTWDYMVNMLCYFMYKGHLCLVFELLGLNLYEVLKKRQFRGLPLTVVRKLVHQAVLGAKELAQKSIVHCDLKPENVLLVTDDDVDSVVTAGESKRLSSSLRSGASLEKKQNLKEPPTSTDTVTTTGEQSRNSGNSTSTSNTDNTQKKKTEQQGLGDETDRSPAMTGTTVSLNKTPPTSISGAKDTTRLAMSSSPTHSDGTNTTGTHGYSLAEQRIKLIDFGSACFEGQTSHTYIQSRFYRSPEVLIGLTYDSAIDIWSLGCVAAELFLGLPILPGVHEHDQLCRICEMIGEIPDWMLDQGSKSPKYYVKFVPAPTPVGDQRTSPPARHLPQWRIKTQSEFISSLSENEIKRKGGLAKLEKHPTNRYFKRKRLADIILHKGQSGGLQEEYEQLLLFVHFLYGILDPDPWKRWTAFQAASHPFLTGNTSEWRPIDVNAPPEKDENHANKICGYYWEAPSDPTIYRRKLLNVQKTREKQQAARQRVNRHGHSRTQSPNQPVTMHEERHSTHVQQVESQVGRRIRPGSYQLSSSLSDFGNYQSAQLCEDSASVASGQAHFITGPQSYSEAGPSGPLPGSFNELDFAYALQRPGVVPMGDTSVCSSIDLSSVGLLSSYSHQQLLQHHQQTSYPTVGSYGSHRVSRNQQSQRSLGGNMSSRSFDEGGRILPNSVQESLSTGHQVLLSSSQGSGAGPGLPSNMSTSSVPQNMSSPTNEAAPAPSGLPGMVPLQQQPQQSTMDSSMNAQHVYLQQQHAALQQQQLLLQQQQAALALQQQQLQAYGMNPIMMSPNAAANPGGFAFNPQQLGILGGQGAPPGVGGGGYYYVSAADGTPMLMAANPGMLTAQQMQGSQFPSGILGQSPGAMNSSGMIGQQQFGAPTLTGMSGMMAFPPAGFPGMMAMNSPSNPSSNNNGSHYSNQQNGHIQFQQR